MSCNCNKAFAVPAGAVNINLGIYKPNVAVNLLFKTATNRCDVIQTTCDTSGNIIIGMPALRQNTPYEVTLAEQTDATQTAKEWEVSANTIQCLSLQFAQPYQGDALLSPELFTVSLMPW
jgi:hypothetical protein